MFDFDVRLISGQVLGNRALFILLLSITTYNFDEISLTVTPMLAF